MARANVFCSTIIPTIGRRTLSRAVASVLDQQLDTAEFEVIVVNDSGRPLPEMDWQRSGRVRVIDTDHRERSVARNTGAAIARGKYLHFLDDDDELLPGALATFWTLDQTRTGGAIWLFGSYQTTDNDGKVIGRFQPGLTGDIFAIVVAGESVPFQVSLLDNRHFFLAGAFDADPTIIGEEDRDLGRRLALIGTVASTPEFVAKIRIGEQGSTTNWANLAEGDRLGREKALNAPRAFARLRTSATTSYWHGRVARAYLASLVWNLKHRRFAIALSRGVLGAAMTAWHVVAPEFWRGLRTRVGDRDAR